MLSGPADSPLASRLLVGLVPFLMVASASAADWVYLTTSASKGNVFVDSESVVRGKDGVAKMWIRTEYASPQYEPGVGNYSVTVDLQQFRCSERTSRSKSATYYFFSDAKSFNGENAAYVDVVPESVGEALFEVACGKRVLEKTKVRPIGSDMSLVDINLSPCQLRSRKLPITDVIELQITCSSPPSSSTFIDEWRAATTVSCPSKSVDVMNWGGTRYEQYIGDVGFPINLSERGFTTRELVEEALVKKYCPATPPPIEGVPAS